LKEIGIPINEVGNTTTQLYVMTKFYEFLHTPGNAVLDRCALDGMAYTMFFYPEMTENMQSVFERMFEEMVFKYDAICYVVPELPLIDDGVRSVDKNFYDQVVQNFDILISEYQIPVHYISGSVETRTHQVLDIISNLETKN
jgi:nicotinamide riboside kinase